MVQIKSLNDLEIYTDSLKFARLVYALTRSEKMKHDYSLISQIRRAALSVPANIAEGYGRKSKRDFSQFVSISLGSVNEVLTYLDFINLEYHIDVSEIRVHYDILAKRIYRFRLHLLKSST